MGFFKPPVDAFLSDLRSKDRRSAKEWEYINGAGVWTELGLSALEVAKTQGGTLEDVGKRGYFGRRKLLTQRWKFLYNRLYDSETDRFDLSRIPDVHDSARLE